MTQKDQNWLQRIVKKNNKASAEKLRVLFNSSSMKTVSTKTIRRNLHKMDLVGSAAAKKLRMRAETRVNRLLWAKHRRNRTVEKWKRVVFSDECKFSLKSDGRVYVWRTTGVRYKPEKTIEKTTSHFSMMFWGCISGNRSRVLLKTPKRCKSADYIDLLKTAKIDTLGEDQFFMDDNSSIHRSREVKQWLHDIGIAKEFLPPYSPDSNPRENVWAQMKRELNAMHLTPNTLKEAVYSVWNNVKDTFIEKLYSSMPNRNSQCIRNSGFSI